MSAESYSSPILFYGLGNPGSVYEGTRHDLGSRLLKSIGRRLQIRLKADRPRGIAWGSGSFEGSRVILARSMGFMNHSGAPLKPLMAREAVALDHLLVLHDDTRLLFGQLELQSGGPQRGQNGLRSIVGELKSEAFFRLRLGLANAHCHVHLPDYQDRVAAFVLAPFTQEEQERIEEWLEEAVTRALEWATRRKEGS